MTNAIGTWAECTPDDRGRRRWWLWYAAPYAALIVQTGPGAYTWTVRCMADRVAGQTAPTCAAAIGEANDAILYAASPALELVP